MSFCSIDFLVFFPIVVLAYYIIPNTKKVNLKSIWLLIASYYFYMSWSIKYSILIFLSTLITYGCGIIISHINENEKYDKKRKMKKNLALSISFIINLAILAFFKYGQFFLNSSFVVLRKVGVSANTPVLNILLPVGISFYTFQALGYTMDVYRDEIKAEKNFVQYALFVSFFPQLVAGPIERSKNLLLQLSIDNEFDLDNVRDGLLIMLWGFFMKLVIADRAAIFVDSVYNDYNTFGGWYIIVATILFGFQIYCDFNGYTMIARGAAKVMGFNLMENFDAPYLATSVAGFWKRWHISLTSWFRDYLYIPLGGNRKGKIRTYINILIVFGVSGLWHGAEWSFVIWGLLNGIYQVAGSALKPFRDKIVSSLSINRESLGHKIISVITTFAMVDFAWMFFRADTIRDGINMITQMVKNNNIWVLFDHESLYSVGLDRYDFSLLIFAICILLSADVIKTRKINIMNDVIYKQDLWCRWFIYIVAFMFVLIFGIWGSGYENTAFLYFQF